MQPHRPQGAMQPHRLQKAMQPHRPPQSVLLRRFKSVMGDTRATALRGTAERPKVEAKIPYLPLGLCAPGGPTHA
eukprot:10361803-Alexandrium_andersonii.AAC.1